MDRLPIQAPIDKGLAGLLAERPTFFWSASSKIGLLHDRISKTPGSLVESATVGYGGIANALGGGNRHLLFANGPNFGASEDFQGICLVYVNDPNNVAGEFVKIGAASGGVGFGGGVTTSQTAGPNLIVVREGIVWANSSAGTAFVHGLNVITFYRTSQSVCGMLNHSTGIGLDGGGTTLASSGGVGVNGGIPGRSSSARTAAVAIWRESLDNAGTVAARTRRAEYVLRYSGNRRPRALFAPQTRRFISLGAAPILAPVLSGATAIDIGPTSMRPRVTITI